MRLDTITLVLSGEISLEAFATGIARLADLVHGLAVDVQSQAVRWLIDDLERSSALATVRGIGEIDQVERVVRAYEVVGSALEENRPIPYSRRVISATDGLRALLNEKVESMRFETAEREATIRAPEPVSPQIEAAPARQKPTDKPAAAAYGAVEGRVQTLSNRGGLRFTVYDLLHDRAVSCYLREGAESIMRDAWGRLATVEGWVSRDPLDGRPLTIRQVARVTLKPDPTGSYRDARGVAPSLTGLLPKQAIRQLRNAGGVLPDLLGCRCLPLLCERDPGGAAMMTEDRHQCPNVHLSK